MLCPVVGLFGFLSSDLPQSFRGTWSGSMHDAYNSSHEVQGVTLMM